MRISGKERKLPGGMLRKMCCLLLAVLLSVGIGISALGEGETGPSEDGWVNFLLICNEGMNNDKGNAGNTLMAVAMNQYTGVIRLMMMTWDTFVDYEGYDVPQKLDMAYRNNGPEEAVKVFNANFGTEITRYMSLNYLNLASLIDSYGGVDVDITRAERNALNGMVASKKNQLQAQVATGLLSQTFVEMLAREYYLNDFGPDTHLNGLQAVGFGWLQYDSVYNCCLRDVKVISKLFHSVGAQVGDNVAFYTNETGEPENVQGKRLINLDNVTEEDIIFFRRQMDPIFQMSYNNLTEEEIVSISITLARAAYLASRQGANIFDLLEYTVFPLEALQPYDVVAGAKGHLIDKEKNAEAIQDFLYGER